MLLNRLARPAVRCRTLLPQLRPIAVRCFATGNPVATFETTSGNFKAELLLDKVRRSSGPTFRLDGSPQGGQGVACVVVASAGLATAARLPWP
jgi:hypothetical protein